MIKNQCQGVLHPAEQLKSKAGEQPSEGQASGDGSLEIQHPMLEVLLDDQGDVNWAHSQNITRNSDELRYLVAVHLIHKAVWHFTAILPRHFYDLSSNRSTL